MKKFALWVATIIIVIALISLAFSVGRVTTPDPVTQAQEDAKAASKAADRAAESAKRAARGLDNK